MSFQENIASDVQKLAVGNVVTLYEIDLSDILGANNEVLYFSESIDNDFTPIVFNSREYIPIHMKTSGWQTKGSDTMPRPLVSVSNVLLTFASYINSFDSLVGAKFTRRRTLEKYLDGKPTANPSAEFAPDIFKILSMPQKTKGVVQFELTPYVDFELIKLPKRQILRDFCRQTYRRWDAALATFVYTKATCPYVGDYCYTRLGVYTTTESLDSCGKEITDCEMRFAGQKAVELTAEYGDRDIYIQGTAPITTQENDYWLDTSQLPVIWYTMQSLEWYELVPYPLPTYSFPSVSRFKI